MRKLVRTDSQGRKSLVELPDDAPDSHAHMGILVGPPHLTDLKLPQAVEIRLNNELFARRLFTRQDLKGRTQDVLAALQAAYKVSVTDVLNLYEGVENA